MNCLSIGGKLTLCKSVLGGLEVYLFSMYKAPRVILKKLEKLIRNFFWASSMNKRKYLGWLGMFSLTIEVKGDSGSEV